ncbi:MAG: acyltransferase [Piscinibacter sp.]|uniref:acyltransferase family protein n=1 Tax=Piscinibacter sp. TaxID=1903157 RepID=UPI001B543792|nr:acyltransferase family protein [Piscinibacter sp.]MBP5988440.1 acyltransferase [Piscinibacter sp.]MBP6026072.1 acyltransferase [Piscinibacter sp.]
MTLRLDIEGLRALSILFVVAYHYLPVALPGGYVGVDVFFVISGYLITLSLVHARDGSAGAWSAMLAFWARRARRLLPNALLVLLAASIAGLAVLSDYGLKRLGSDVFWSATYSVNWLFVLRALDYLQWDDARTSVLLNFWSLAVEEQFYLVWPALLLAGLRWRRAAGLALMLALLSFAYCLLLAQGNRTLGFLSSPARAWELLAGAWLALHLRGRDDSLSAQFSPVGADALFAVSLTVLALAALWFGEDTAHPGLPTLIPVAGAVGAIAFGATSPLARRTLGSAAVRWVGARSYSIYLWHWPVLVLGRPLLAGAAAWTIWLLLPISLLLAELAYRAVETPARFRWGRTWSSRRVLAVALAAGGCVALLGFGLRAAGAGNARELLALRPGAVPGAVSAREIQRASEDLPVLYRLGCHLSLEQVDPGACVFGQRDGTTAVALFGDSHAAQWFPALDEVARGEGDRLLVWTKSSCPSADVSVWNQVARAPYQQCDLWPEEVFRRVEALRPRLVIVSNLIEDATVLVSRRDGRPIKGREAQAAYLSGLMQTIERLQRGGAIVVVLRDAPRPRPDLMDCLGANADVRKCELGVTEATTAALDVQAAERSGTLLWDLTPFICPGGHCPVLWGNSRGFVYRDSNHLAASFVASLAPELRPLWRRSLAPQAASVPQRPAPIRP